MDREFFDDSFLGAGEVETENTNDPTAELDRLVRGESSNVRLRSEHPADDEAAKKQRRREKLFAWRAGIKKQLNADEGLMAELDFSIERIIEHGFEAAV
jgi:hypothetical protein